LRSIFIIKGNYFNLRDEKVNLIILIGQDRVLEHIPDIVLLIHIGLRISPPAPTASPDSLTAHSRALRLTHMRISARFRGGAVLQLVHLVFVATSRRDSSVSKLRTLKVVLRLGVECQTFAVTVCVHQATTVLNLVVISGRRIG
jgi:hypothetical protein